MQISINSDNTLSLNNEPTDFLVNQLGTTTEVVGLRGVIPMPQELYLTDTVAGLEWLVTDLLYMLAV